ncbi:unnamed protein product [Protopolystoma xenopodis]|uniref:Uncharacterized protein n=1 Tax=Protopolystoma xenopodis TaxID=117903 RepID=A0A448X0W8_9PLAT|nr:unnamed protein product [Protopolystoma xenopodis]
MQDLASYWIIFGMTSPFFHRPQFPFGEDECNQRHRLGSDEIGRRLEPNILLMHPSADPSQSPFVFSDGPVTFCGH